MPRVTETQETWQKERYLQALAKTGTLTHGCRAARVSHNTIYRWRETDDTFVLREHQAREQCADTLEASVLRRANNRSDTLAIFMLKAMRPEKYRERHDITTGGQPIDRGIDIDSAIDRRLAELAARGEGTIPLAIAGATIPTDT